MKKILVSGGSDGIGAAIVRAFSASGDTVAFIYRRSDNLATALNNECGAIPIKADLSNKEEAKHAANEAIELLGGIDVLINNVGSSHIGLLTDMTDEEWEHILNTNLSAAFYLTRKLSSAMVHNHSGRIINIGSVWGRVGASCEVAYSATKSALRGFTMALAKELGPSGITVNCIEPGVIDTRMNACFDEQAKADLIDETPLCRIGTPADVADLAYFLASDKASFITGQCIGVDGGFGL